MSGTTDQIVIELSLDSSGFDAGATKAKQSATSLGAVLQKSNVTGFETRQVDIFNQKITSSQNAQIARLNKINELSALIRSQEQDHSAEVKKSTDSLVIARDQLIKQYDREEAALNAQLKTINNIGKTVTSLAQTGAGKTVIKSVFGDLGQITNIGGIAKLAPILAKAQASTEASLSIIGGAVKALNSEFAQTEKGLKKTEAAAKVSMSVIGGAAKALSSELKTSMRDAEKTISDFDRSLKAGRLSVGANVDPTDKMFSQNVSAISKQLESDAKLRNKINEDRVKEFARTANYEIKVAEDVRKHLVAIQSAMVADEKRNADAKLQIMNNVMAQRKQAAELDLAFWKQKGIPIMPKSANPENVMASVRKQMEKDTSAFNKLMDGFDERMAQGRANIENKRLASIKAAQEAEQAAFKAFLNKKEELYNREAALESQRLRHGFGGAIVHRGALTPNNSPNIVSGAGTNSIGVGSGPNSYGNWFKTGRIEAMPSTMQMGGYLPPVLPASEVGKYPRPPAPPPGRPEYPPRDSGGPPGSLAGSSLGLSASMPMKAIDALASASMVSKWFSGSVGGGYGLASSSVGGGVSPSVESNSALNTSAKAAATSLSSLASRASSASMPRVSAQRMPSVPNPKYDPIEDWMAPFGFNNNSKWARDRNYRNYEDKAKDEEREFKKLKSESEMAARPDILRMRDALPPMKRGITVNESEREAMGHAGNILRTVAAKELERIMKVLELSPAAQEHVRGKRAIPASDVAGRAAHDDKLMNLPKADVRAVSDFEKKWAPIREKIQMAAVRAATTHMKNQLGYSMIDAAQGLDVRREMEGHVRTAGGKFRTDSGIYSHGGVQLANATIPFSFQHQKLQEATAARTAYQNQRMGLVPMMGAGYGGAQRTGIGHDRVSMRSDWAPLPMPVNQFVRGGQANATSAAAEAAQNRLASSEKNLADWAARARQPLEDCATSLRNVSSAASSALSRMRTDNAARYGYATNYATPGSLPGTTAINTMNTVGMRGNVVPMTTINSGLRPGEFGGPGSPGIAPSGFGEGNRNARRENVGALSGKLQGIMGQEDTKSLAASVTAYNAKLRQLMEERERMMLEFSKRTSAQRATRVAEERGKNAEEARLAAELNLKLAALAAEKARIGNMDRQWRMNNISQFGGQDASGAAKAAAAASPTAALEAGEVTKAYAPTALVADRIKGVMAGMRASFATGKNDFGGTFEAIAAGAGRAARGIEALGKASVVAARGVAAVTSVAVGIARLPYTGLAKASEGLNMISFAAWKLTSGMNTLKMAWDGVLNIAKRGEEFERTKYAFETMTSGIGLSIENLRRASGNMIDDKALMKLSNFGAAAKLDAKTIEMMTSRAQGASLLTGRDTSEVMRRMVQGVAKREKEIMDEITVIMPSMALVNRQKAKDMHKSTTDLTEQEKTDAYVAAFEKASVHLEKATKMMPAKLTEMQKFQAALTNTVDQFSAKITKVLVDSGMLERVGGMISGFLDGVSEFVNSEGFRSFMGELNAQLPGIMITLGKALNSLMPLLGLATPLLAMIGQILEGLLPAFKLLADLVIFVSGILINVFVKALAMVAEVLAGLTSFIPGVGDATKAFADATSKASAELLKMGDSSKAVISTSIDLASNTEKVNDQFRTQITTIFDLKSAMDGLAASQAEVISNAAKIPTTPTAPTETQKAFDILKAGPEGVLRSGSVTQLMKGAFETQGEADKQLSELMGSMGGRELEIFQRDAQNRASRSRDELTEEQRQKDLEANFGKFFTWEDGAGDGNGEVDYAEKERKYNEQLDKYNKLMEAREQAARMLQSGARVSGLISKGYDEDNVGKFKNDTMRGVMDTAVEAGRNNLKLSIPTTPDSSQTLEEIIGQRNPLLKKENIEYARDMTAQKFEEFLDVISIDPDAQVDKGEWKYSEGNVRANIKQFSAYTDQKADEIIAIEEEIAYIQSMSAEQLQSLSDASMTQADLEQARADLIAGKQVTLNETKAEHTLASETTQRLRDRLPPPKARGGKQPRMILPEIIDMTAAFTKEAGAYKEKKGIGGKATGIAPVAEDFSARMADELTKILYTNFKEDIKKHEGNIKQVADEAMLVSQQIMADAVAAQNPEDFRKLMDASNAFDQALTESGFMDMADESGKYRQAVAAKGKNLEIYLKQWEATERVIELSKEAAERAKDGAFTLAQKRLEIEAEFMRHQDAKTMWSGGAEGFGNKVEFTAADLPDWRVAAATKRDPAMEAFEAETARSIEKIKERVAAEVKAYKDEWSKSRKEGPFGGIEGLAGLSSIESAGASEIGALEEARNLKRTEKMRAQVEASAQVYKDLWQNVGGQMSGMVGEALTYPMVDAFSVWQNATLDMTEDWGDNMIAYIESVTMQIGGMAQQAAEVMIGEATGNAFIGKLGGGLVKGIFDGLKSLFKKKNKNDEDKERRQEREMRRKETKKVAEFSVTFINQSLPVSAFTQNQIVKNIEGALTSGVKIKGLTGR